jgi:hypothetical protein
MIPGGTSNPQANDASMCESRFNFGKLNCRTDLSGRLNQPLLPTDFTAVFTPDSG